MSTCEACGTENRPGARYCSNCAAALLIVRPTDADRQWLAVTLADMPPQPATTGITGPLPAPDEAPAGAEERLMDAVPPAGPPRFAQRYELSDAAPGPVTVVDTAPWRRCWACGSTANEAGESFCMDCGAALEQRSYRGVLSPADAPQGAALLAAVADEGARALLPELWEQVEDDGKLLTILRDSGRAALAPPVDETTALTVGAALSRLLVTLHGQDLALGAIAPGDLEPLAGGKTRLRDAPNLRRIADDARGPAVAADLAGLGELLEQLTATPRTTQRLDDEDAAAAVAADAGLAELLRQVRTGALTSADALAARLEAMLEERTRPASLRQLVGAATNTGIVRDHNEDSYLTLSLGLDNNNQPQGWGLYVVSDGMGGHAAGELASGLAIRGVAELVLAEYLAQAVGPDMPYNESDARDIVRRAALRANEAVIAEAQAQGNDMGATLTMALVIGDRAIVGNVGDSRTYLYRDGKLRRISKDHSLVMRLVDLGQISDEDIYTHPQRNAVLRSLGDKRDVEVDVFSERVRAGDILLLCSDGQWEMTRDAEMERVISRGGDLQKACETLVAAANQAGGDDNITIVLVAFS